MAGPDRPSILSSQHEHWETMLAQKPEMFGSSPSDPASKAAEIFRAEGVRRILELGGGQGRDTFFLVQSGFTVDVLDYAAPGVEAIARDRRDRRLDETLHASTRRKITRRENQRGRLVRQDERTCEEPDQQRRRRHSRGKYTFFYIAATSAAARWPLSIAPFM